MRQPGGVRARFLGAEVMRIWWGIYRGEGPQIDSDSVEIFTGFGFGSFRSVEFVFFTGSKEQGERGDGLVRGGRMGQCWAGPDGLARAGSDSFFFFFFNQTFSFFQFSKQISKPLSKPFQIFDKNTF